VVISSSSFEQIFQRDQLREAREVTSTKLVETQTVNVLIEQSRRITGVLLIGVGS
jgi:hypothetical protein